MAEKIDTNTNEYLHCSCTSSKDNIGDYPELKVILPDDFKYTVCHWKKLDADHFEVKFRVNVATENDYDKWLYLFEQSSKTEFISNKTLPKFKEVILTSLRCEEMTPVNKPADDAPERKDVDPSTVKPIVYFEKKCTTRIVMIVRLDGFAKVCDIPDVHLDEFPMTVIYHHLHNHPPVDFSPCQSPPPFMVDESKLSEKELQRRQILAALREAERHLQEIAAKRAGHDPEEFKIKNNPFSLASLYEALSSINRKDKKHNRRETGNRCLLHLNEDPYSKALDFKSLGNWLFANRYDMVTKGNVAPAATSVDGGAAAATSVDGGAAAATSVGGGAAAATSVDGGAAAATSVGGGAAAATSVGGGATAATSVGGGAAAATSVDGGAAAATSVDDGGAAAATSVVDGGAASSVDGGGYWRVGDVKTFLSSFPECSYMFTNPKISEKLKKIMKEATLEDSEK